MTKEVNIYNLGEQPCDIDNQSFEINLIENLTSEHNKEIELEVECDVELEFEDLSLDKIANSTTE